MLRLEAECRSVFILCATLQSVLSSHKIASIKLDTRFLGFNIHHNARLITGHSCRVLHTRSPEYKVVVVAFSKFQLLTAVIDARADGSWLCKIKWSTRNRLKLSCWNEC